MRVERLGAGSAVSAPVIVFVAALAGLLGGGDDLDAFAQESGRRVPALPAVRAPAPPAIDGLVGDAEWQGAAVATDFIQYEPRRGEPSGVRTETLVLYDAGHLYVAFRAFDPEPVTAQLTQRDAELLHDDAVAVLLDSYDDGRTAYLFITNALGTQADLRVSDDGRQVDGSWDAAWQSAATRIEGGWSAEFAIPLTSIKYAASGDQAWGINFGRSRRRTLEFSTWSGPLETEAQVSRAGRLTGLSVAPPAARHQLIPYGLARLQDGASSQWQAGVDLRYALTPQAAAYATVNPDFATIEADQEEVNLTRFEISLPEKRQFFLEGQELFGQRIRTFYSRRIADIAGGGKVLGKQGRWTANALSVESDPLAGGDRANYTVGRLQRDVFGRSSVGAMMANRSLAGVNQGSVSVDANLFFTRTIGMTAQAIESWGPFARGSGAFFLRPSYDSATGHFHVRYTDLGEHLADNINVIGQIKDDDRREIDSALEKTIWVRNGAFEQVQYESNYNVYWSQHGVLRSWQINQGADVQFRNRWSAGFAYAEEFKRFEKDFRNRRAALAAGYNTREYQSVEVQYTFGRNFDSDFRLWSATARGKVTPQLSAEYSLERLLLDPDPDGETTWIHVVRASQFFTKDLFLKVYVQTNSAIDRRNVQAVFVWRYRPPFGSVQVAYQRGTAGFGERSDQGHTLFLKTTAVF